MAPTKQERFEEFRRNLLITCSCGYSMKCITKPSAMFVKDIITTEELVMASEVTLPIPSVPLVYECVNCLKQIRIENYE